MGATGHVREARRWGVQLILAFTKEFQVRHPTIPQNALEGERGRQP